MLTLGRLEPSSRPSSMSSSERLISSSPPKAAAKAAGDAAAALGGTGAKELDGDSTLQQLISVRKHVQILAGASGESLARVHLCEWPLTAGLATSSAGWLDNSVDANEFWCLDAMTGSAALSCGL